MRRWDGSTADRCSVCAYGRMRTPVIVGQYSRLKVCRTRVNNLCRVVSAPGMTSEPLRRGFSLYFFHGYARVSTVEQRSDVQTDALQAAGCVRVFADTASGAVAERPQLSAALDHLRDGTPLSCGGSIVWALHPAPDRHGRPPSGTGRRLRVDTREHRYPPPADAWSSMSSAFSLSSSVTSSRSTPTQVSLLLAPMGGWVAASRSQAPSRSRSPARCMRPRTRPFLRSPVCSACRGRPSTGTPNDRGRGVVPRTEVVDAVARRGRVQRRCEAARA